MESSFSVREAIHPGDWATSVDLRDAYFHVSIHPRHRKWLRFVWGDQVFQFRVLPFGLSLAPWIFSRIVRELCRFLRREGIRLRVYLDDWLTLAESCSLCQFHTLRVLQCCTQLGFCVNHEKSNLSPSQRFLYLGMAFDTVQWLVRPADHRVQALLTAISRLLSQSSASARQLASLLENMESLAPLVSLVTFTSVRFSGFFAVDGLRSLKIGRIGFLSTPGS